MMISYSFIIPHKNAPQLLERCLNSIPQRDDIQVIVVDDNSDIDKKPSIIRNDVIFIELDACDSKGAGHARNVGITYASGVWLLFADCDDYYSKDFITILDKYRYSDIDILYFRVNTYVNGASSSSIRRSWIDCTFDYYFSSKQDIYYKRWLGLSHNCPWNKMYNRQYIKAIDCQFAEIPVGNDAWFVNYAGAMADKVEVINDRLYNYLILSNGITLSKRPLSHYLKLIQSDNKCNRLKVKNKCLNLLFVPGFNKDIVIRDYGRTVYYRLIVMRLLTEPYFVLACLMALLRRLHIIKKIL